MHVLHLHVKRHRRILCLTATVMRPHSVRMQSTPLERGLERDREIPWGARMRAYREMAGLQMKESAALITEAWPTSAMTLSRLEDRAAPPTQRRSRIVALLALVMYGVHPESMGISFDELPAFVDERKLAAAIKKARRSSARSRCIPTSFEARTAFSFDAA